MGNPAQLKTFLTETFAAADGCLSFERFMELALYHPVFGYYTANIEDVGGSRGDFSTWATLATPGKPVANWIKEEFSRYGRLPVIEIGAGDGSMAQSILKNFTWRERRKLSYHIVEISPPLRAFQKALLKRKSITWHDNIQSALKSNLGKAIIFSNELVDAFPATWLRWNGKIWDEIFVQFSPESGLKEVFRPSELKIEWQTPPAGQRIERHDSYFRWMESWLPHFESGSLLTIDYGSDTHSKNPNGTVRGYFRQQRIEGPGVYQRFGNQDLTCDVNFSTLIKHGEKNDLKTVRLENQLDFMKRFDFEEVEHPGAAEAFMVLHQRK